MSVSLSYSGTSLELGKVLNERTNLVTNLIVFNSPAQASDSTLSYDILGKTKTITIDGFLYGTIANIKTYKDAIMSWVDSVSSDGGMPLGTYSSDMTTAVTVQAESFDGTWLDGSPYVYQYTLVLVVTSGAG